MIPLYRPNVTVCIRIVTGRTDVTASSPVTYYDGRNGYCYSRRVL